MHGIKLVIPSSNIEEIDFFFFIFKEFPQFFTQDHSTQNSLFNKHQLAM